MSRHIVSVLVENEAGALSRIAGLFSARGYNIESLTVAPTEDASMSRMTIVTTGSEDVVEQITKQLNKLIEVVKVIDLSEAEHIERELMLVKVRAVGEVYHLHHVHQLVQLLGNLLHHLVRTGGDYGHSRERGVLGRRHRQRLDVVAARGEQPRDARKRARLVLHEDADDVAAHNSSDRIISVIPLPPGIIG